MLQLQPEGGGDDVEGCHGGDGGCMGMNELLWRHTMVAVWHVVLGRVGVMCHEGCEPLDRGTNNSCHTRQANLVTISKFAQILT